MKRIRCLLAAGLLALLVLTSAGCNKLRARDQLNRGVEAYKNARYEAAIEHFKKACGFDPGLLNARLYLATAYAQQYVPGADTSDNKRYAQQAIAEYKNVLAADPSNIVAIKGAANLYLQEKKLDLAKQFFARAAQVNPNDPEAYYSMAYVDWSQAYVFRQDERNQLGMKDPTAPLEDKRVCGIVREHNAPLVDEGMDLLHKALKLRPDYDDAMAYMNLMYRERADYECDNPAARTADLKTADEWVAKTLATKREKASRQRAGGAAGTQK